MTPDWAWYDECIGGNKITTAHDVLSKLDEAIRISSYADGNYTIDTLTKNMDEFIQRVSDLLLLIVRSNLKHDTRESKRVGTFPKYEGEPGISHLVWELDSKD